jgi:hypothetical protein
MDMFISKKRLVSQFEPFEKPCFVIVIFDQPTNDATYVSMHYVGILKNMFRLDYGPMHTPIKIFRCEWVK